jgi:hypothetical protein
VKVRALILIAFLVFVVAGCATKDISFFKKDEKPSWYWNPSKDGLVGGVGVSKVHINGVDAQRRLAVSRAIDAIAVQYGVKVRNITSVSSKADSSGASNVSIESYSIQSSDGINVSASVREFWIDPYTNELYVWMVVEK